MIDIAKLIITIVICELAGIIGSFFTMKSVDGWYRKIKKPSFNPPSWIFGPVWTLLYLMMGISLYFIWISAGSFNIVPAIFVFAIQLFLNLIWSLLFFKLHSPKWAFVDIVLMFIAILTTIIVFYPISKIAAYLLVPYILWVIFASLLNFKIWELNRK
jgi:benzodiazapine receptor